MSIAWNDLINIIHAHERFLLTSHVRPDCDALGSELGMAHLLESLGKSVRIVNADEVPANLKFIDPDERIETLADVVLDELEQIDVLMVLDTSAWIQLGSMADVLRHSKARKVVFDHHVSEDDLGADTFKNPQAEATGRLVIELAEHLEAKLTPQMARPLFAAMATDTGWFRFPAVTASTYEYVAKLVAAGADQAEIYNCLYEQDTIARVNLRGLILGRAVSELDGRLGHAVVFQRDFEQVGAVRSDTEDVVNMILAIAGMEVALLMTEQPDGSFKISFRSRSAVDVSQVAETFGGGGHRAAAGATVQGAPEEVCERVLTVVRQAMA